MRDQNQKFEKLLDYYWGLLPHDQKAVFEEEIKNDDEAQAFLKDISSMEQGYQKMAFQDASFESLVAVRRKAKEAFEKKKSFSFSFLLQFRNALVYSFLVVVSIGLGFYYDDFFGNQKSAPEVALNGAEEKLSPKTEEGIHKSSFFYESTRDGQTLIADAKKEDAPEVKEDTIDLVDPAFRAVSPFANVAVKTSAHSRGLSQSLITDNENQSPKDQKASMSDLLYKEALFNENMGNIEKAVSIYQKIWIKDRNFAQRDHMLYRWSNSLIKLRRHREAAQKISLLKKINPRYPGLQDLASQVK